MVSPAFMPALSAGELLCTPPTVAAVELEPRPVPDESCTPRMPRLPMWTVPDALPERIWLTMALALSIGMANPVVGELLRRPRALEPAVVMPMTRFDESRTGPPESPGWMPPF